jgi:hypothetical protein
MADALKPLMRFVREAAKIEKVNDVAAYYLRLHAVTSAMKVCIRSSLLGRVVFSVLSILLLTSSSVLTKQNRWKERRRRT